MIMITCYTLMTTCYQFYSNEKRVAHTELSIMIVSAYHVVGRGFMPRSRRDGLVVSVSASHAVGRGFMPRSRRDGLVVSVSASHVVGRGFMPRPRLDDLMVSVPGYHAPAESGWLSGNSVA